MWQLNEAKPVKLVCGILACDEQCAAEAVEASEKAFGKIDIKSKIWPFTHTGYYKNEAGSNMVKTYVSFEKLVRPEKLADIKIKSNKLEKKLAEKIGGNLPRPVNLDTGYIEPSKLILASTKNFAHRIYVGKKIWAEVTLCFHKGLWKGFDYTFPDHKENRYHQFFSSAREKLVRQLKG